MKRIIVAIGSHPKTGVLLKTAKRRAFAMGADWIALHVETPDFFLQDAEQKQRILRFMTEAEEMGAQIQRIQAQTVEDGIIDYLNGLDLEDMILFMGKPAIGSTGRLRRKTLAERIKRRKPDHCEISTIVLSGRPHTSGIWYEVFRLHTLSWRHVLYALLAVAAAYFFSVFLQSTMSYAESSVNSYNLAMIFILPPVVIAGRFGLIPGLIAAAGSFFTMNYFFINPIRQVDFSGYVDFINASLFLGAALIVALFGSYTLAYSENLRRKERRTQALFAINEVISTSYTRDEALEKLYHELTEFLGMEVAILLPPAIKPNDIELAYPKRCDLLTAYDWDAVRKSWSDVVTSGFGTPRFTKSNWRFEPMITGQDRVGILGIYIPKNMELDLSFGQLVASLADQSANILERLEMSATMEVQRISQEREKLRSMLLSSVSHDLKTPLSSIIGSLSVYHGMHELLPPEKLRELTETALDEAQRLDSFITNILDMTRIESGQIQFKREWHNPDEMVKRVIKRLRQRLRHHHIELLNSDLPIEIETDVMMTEQVLQNLLDNAAKYTPPDSTISVDMETTDLGFFLSVRDTGKGIPTDRIEKIFDKYERIKLQDNKVAGTGLGLAIAKAIIEGQDGNISADNHKDGGAIFTIFLPNYRTIEQKDRERATS